MEEQTPCLEDPTTTKEKMTIMTSPFSPSTYSYKQDKYKNWKEKKRLKNSQYKI